ncbi:hypothetical protein JTE90_010418 [Oedothorax gibbosus]|uniref:Uncharacterized protein n=1 Tax=Oedothorax gibbosus TaxID=931172 RepID=A0AAV6W540_9ARAC|nr:hypothetical protein JTE90_010418 [Oedothorax gibbosus]
MKSGAPSFRQTLPTIKKEIKKTCMARVSVAIADELVDRIASVRPRILPRYFYRTSIKARVPLALVCCEGQGNGFLHEVKIAKIFAAKLLAH